MQKRGVVERMLGKGVFPHQAAWILELPWRRLVLSQQTLVDRLQLAPHMNVLEIGPGSGYYSIPVSQRIPSGQLSLLDIQPEMLVRCAQKLRAAGARNAQLVSGSAERLPFGSDRFDRVFMVTVLGEVPNADACLREVRRILGDRGVLSISEHLPDPDLISFPRLRRLVEQHGFQLQERYGSRISYTANFVKA